jgi:hypothetical protein
MLEIDYKQFKRSKNDDGDEHDLIPIHSLLDKTKKRYQRVRYLTQWVRIRHAIKDWTFPFSDSMFVLDCGGSGSCMFHVIAAGLNLYLKQPIFAMPSIRKMVAEQVNASNVASVLSGWKSDEGTYLRKRYNEMVKHGNESSIQNLIRQVQTVIADSCNRYQTWGDEIMLELLLKAPLFKKMELGFAIVSLRKHTVVIGNAQKNRDEKQQQKKQLRVVASTQLLLSKTTKRLMMLYCHTEKHWELLALKNQTGDMACVFSMSNYPKTLHILLHEQEMLLKPKKPNEK